MLRLPKNIPQELRAALSAQLSNPSIDEALPRIAESVMELFGAADVLLMFEHGSAVEESSRRLFALKSSCGERSEGFFQNLVSGWCQSGIHTAVSNDLKNRLASISYSAFSWPYPHIATDEQHPEEGFAVPRDFTLLLPFSSELIVTSESEPSFFGYLAIFFDSFPNLAETTVQLIITVPGLLSEIAAGFVRQTLSARAEEFGGYAHDIKRYLLINREFLEVIRAGEAKRVSKTIPGIERSLLRVLHQTNSLLLADKDDFGTLKINPVKTNINELVQEASEYLAPLFEGANIGLRLELASDLPDSSLDPAIFPSVLHNLLDNSLKYSEAGNDVIVQTISNDKEGVVLKVTDYGLEISESERDMIFSKRCRGSNVQGVLGNGLGLYLVRRIVQAHGGSVILEQRNDGGKCFVVSLPSIEKAEE